MSIGGPSRLVPRTTQPSAIRSTSTSSRPTGCERKKTRNCVPFSAAGSGGGVWAAAAGHRKAQKAPGPQKARDTDRQNGETRRTNWVTIQLRTCFPSTATRRLLANGGVVRRADRGVLAVSGADRAAWLQGLLTNDVEALKDGESRYAAYLTPQGRMITDMHVVARGEPHPARRAGAARGVAARQARRPDLFRGRAGHRRERARSRCGR